MRRLSTFLALLAVQQTCTAQTTHADSLWSLWTDTTLTDDERGPALFELYVIDSLLDPATAAARVVPEMPVAEVSDRRAFELAWAQAVLAWRRMIEHRWTEALFLENKAYQAFDRLGMVKWRAMAARRMGEILTELGQRSKTIPYKTEAIVGLEALGDSNAVSEMMGDVGYTYLDLGDTASAIHAFERSLAFTEGRDPNMEKFWLSLLASFSPTSDHSMQYVDRIRQLVSSGKATDEEDRIGEVEADRFRAMGECDSAYQRYDRVLKVRRSLGWVSHYPGLIAHKARARLCAHRYQEAMVLAREGLKLARHDGTKADILDNAALLARAYEGMGDHRSALHIWRMRQLFNDSLTRELSASSLTGALMTARFEEETRMDSVVNANEREKERTIAEQRLQKERVRRNVFLFSGLGLLAFGIVVYQQRNRINRARKRSDELLLNILPAEVAEELKITGAAAAKHFDSASILFSDFKGFTSISEKLSPSELVEELNVCFRAFDHLITARGIEKIKTIGDAYMCAGGLPDPASSTPVDVVLAALEMQVFMIARKAERDTQGRPAFEMRVGIHSGPVVAGIVGVKKFQYDIWGDTVNTASRMESSGEVGQVNISEATYALVKNETGLTFTSRGKVQAKGKGEMEMYFVRRSST